MTTNLSLLYHSMAILHKHLYGYVVFIMLKPYAVKVIYNSSKGFSFVFMSYFKINLLKIIKRAHGLHG